MHTMKTAFLKTLAATAVVSGAVFLLSSCHDNEKPIRELETLSADMNLHSADYTAEEWESALEKYQELTDRLQDENLTPEQLQRLGKVKGEIAGYVARQSAREAGSALRDALNEAAGFVDGFLNTAAPDNSGN